MGRKTHGPYLVAAIECNDVDKVNEIISKQFRDRKTIGGLLVSELPRLASDQTDIPLLLAATLPDPAILKYFVGKCKADINHVFELGGPRYQRKTTALFTAVQRSLYETVSAILSLNGDTNVADHKGDRPLHRAIRRADYRMAKMLLMHGAKANVPDAVGNTPLHAATIYGHTELVKLLLHHGADVYKKGQHEALAVHMAAREGHANIVRLFCHVCETAGAEQLKARLPKDVLEQVVSRQLTCVDDLNDRVGCATVNPNIRVPCYDAKDKAPLHVAAEQGHSETVFALVEHCGAGVDVRDGEGETPLHCAVIREYDPLGMRSKEDHTETVKLLLNYGADPNCRNARGETPLHLATRNEFQKAIEVLLLAGGDPISEDRDGNRPIDLTSDDDAVSKQTLQHAIENRERYLSESMEFRARGFSTTTPSQSVLPLSIQSPSLQSMPLLIGAAPGTHPAITRAASTPGLFSRPPHQSGMIPLAYGRQNSSFTPTSSFGSRGQLTTLHHAQISGSLSPTTSIGGMMFSDGALIGIDGLPVSHQMFGRPFSMPNGSSIDIGNDSRVVSPTGDFDLGARADDDTQSIVSTVPSLRKLKAGQHRRCPSDSSSIWEVTPISSVHNSKTDVRESNNHHHDNRQRRASRKVVRLKQTIETMISKSKPPENAVVVTKRPTTKTYPAPLVFSRADSASDDDSSLTDEDSEADARSFVTVSEICENAKKFNNRNIGKVGVRDWLDSHSGSQSVSSETTESSEASSMPPIRPPRHATGASIAPSVEIVAKRRPPPPLPKSRNQIKMPDETTTEEELDETTEEFMTSAEQMIFEIEMDDTKFSGKTVFSVIPVRPMGSKKTHIISNKAAKEAVSKFADDSFVDRLSKCDFSWSGVSCIHTGDVVDKGSVSVSMSCPQRWRFERKTSSEVVKGRTITSTWWDRMPLSPGRKPSCSNADKSKSTETLEKELESIKPPMSFSKPEDFDNASDENLSESSDWSTEEIDTSKHNSSRLQMTVPLFGESHDKQLSPIFMPGSVTQFPISSQRGLVFEKVSPLGMDGVSAHITDDYLLQRSISGLTSATEVKIMQRVNKSFESQLSPGFSNNWTGVPVSMTSVSPQSIHNQNRFEHTQNLIRQNQFDLMQVELQRQRDLQLLELQQRQQQQVQQQQLAAEISRQQQQLMQQQRQKQMAIEVNQQQRKLEQQKRQQQILHQHQQQHAQLVHAEAEKPKAHQEKVPPQQHNQMASESPDRGTKLQPQERKPIRKQQQQLAAEAAMKQKNKQNSLQNNQKPQQDEVVGVEQRSLSDDKERSQKSSPVKLRRRSSGGSQTSSRDRSSGGSFTGNRVSSPIYEELPADRSNKRISIHSDEFVMQYGKNIRYLSYVGCENPGFTVCGGNVSGTFVLRVEPGSVASKAGFTIGDQIVGINWKFVKSLSKEEIFHIMQQPTSEAQTVIVARDDDRFKLASTKNAIGDSFFVRARFNHTPSTKKGELAIKVDDIFQVCDSMPEERIGFWQVKKVMGTFNEPEGYIPNQQRAEKVVTTQRLAMQPDPAAVKQRGGVLRSFRRSKSTDRSGSSGGRGAEDTRAGTDDKGAQSEAGDIVAYERVIQQKSPTKRPVVLMGLFCDAVCAMLAKDSPGLYEFPNVEVERYGEFGEDVKLDMTVIRGIVNRSKHCVMVIAPKAVNFVREKTEFRPIVIYLSPVSKSVVASVKERLAPALDKKIGLMFEEATKFEKYHAGLFDAIVPYKTDSSWFSLLKDTVDRFQRQPQWTAIEVSIPDLYGDRKGGTSPDIIRTTRNGDVTVKQSSLTTDDIPDQIQDLLCHTVTDSRKADAKSDARRNDLNNNMSNQSSTMQHPTKRSILKNSAKHNRSLPSIDFKISTFQTSGPKPAVAVKPPRANLINQYDASPRKSYETSKAAGETQL